jgi:hypothetical protein
MECNACDRVSMRLKCVPCRRPWEPGSGVLVPLRKRGWSGRVEFGLETGISGLQIHYLRRAINIWSAAARGTNTFFCNLTTLVHFFSRSPSYFLLVAASKLSPIFSSSRNAAALFSRFVEVRYAMIDLCLVPLSAFAR